jgi:glutathionylspermidine synthase
MRALVTAPDHIGDGAYQRFLQAALLEGLMADHLVEGEPYLALNAVVLEPRDAVLLPELVEAFTGALVRAGGILARDVPTLVEMGFPWVAAELLAAEEPRAPLVGRFDFVQDDDGHWWLLEFNADTPSGIRETIVVDELVHATVPAAQALGHPSAGFGPALRQVFLETCADLPLGSNLGLLTNTGEMEDLAQIAFMGRLLEPALRCRGVGVVLADLDNVSAPRGRLALCGRPVAALYRGAPYEAMLGTTVFSAIYEAVAAGHLQLFNGLFGLLLQHKGLLAWLWAHRHDPCFTERERWAIRRHLPPTWPIDAYPSATRREELVAKQVFGREGEEVFFGDAVAGDAWDLLRRRRTYVAQQRIEVQQLGAVVATSRGLVSQDGFATVGCFNVREQGIGFYTRFGGRITTNRAKWLATFVDSHPNPPPLSGRGLTEEP